jgi:hypothetical protein
MGGWARWPVDLTPSKSQVYDKPIIRVRIEHGPTSEVGWVSKNSHSGAVLLAEPDTIAAQGLEAPKKDVYDQQLDKLYQSIADHPKAPRRKNKLTNSLYGQEEDSSSWANPRNNEDPETQGDIKVSEGQLGVIKRRKMADNPADVAAQSKQSFLVVSIVTAVVIVVFVTVVVHLLGLTCDNRNECTWYVRGSICTRTDIIFDTYTKRYRPLSWFGLTISRTPAYLVYDLPYKQSIDTAAGEHILLSVR